MPEIVVGVDGSGCSRRALDWAVNEAAIRHTPLTVLTVYQPVRGHWSAAVEYPWDADPAHPRKTVQEEADAALERLTAQARPPEVTARAVIGLPAEEILRLGMNADMIVVGSRGAGDSAKRLMGSVSSQVAQHARCPVVLIPACSRSDEDVRHETRQDLILQT
jgi:nucleotide-binding universal stress UspA family protein